jgi:protoporphyrin/coproporphyrin ferrochelatase
MKKTGVLLIHLGSPKSPSTTDVRAYLREFLADPRVIPLSKLWRWLLLHGVILPFRTRHTARLYQRIWANGPSPLLAHCQQLKQALALTLGERYHVTLGMRYGQPSLAKAIEDLRHHACDEWVILPLYPQYASPTTGSAVEFALKQMINRHHIPSFKVINSFYAHPVFIQALAAVYCENQPAVKPDFVLLSYHGLPISELKKSHCACQPNQTICQEKNSRCYRAQCYTTTRLLAEALGLKAETYATSFQSKMGRSAWTEPDTVSMLATLRQRGIKTLSVMCPSFTADCLETLEEIGVRAKAHWRRLGGETLTLIPCLNHHSDWVQGLKTIIEAG